jgi:hypothetical protein
MKERRQNEVLAEIVNNAIRLRNISIRSAAKLLRKWGFQLGQAHRILLKPWMRRKATMIRRHHAD